MPNYKELYLKMMRASEQAIRTLIRTQQECEELYVSEADLTVLPGKEDDTDKE